MKIRFLRNLSLLAVVGLVIYKGLSHQLNGGGPTGSPPLDSFCPFGGVESLYTFLTTGAFLAKINSSNFVLIGAILLLTIISGASFCSWLCPFGAVQEWLAKLGRKIWGKNYSLPRSIHKNLRYLRFILLFLIIYLTIHANQLVFEKYDPFKILFHFAFEDYTSIIIFIITLILSLLIDRAWCKYLCPLGAIIISLSYLNPIKIIRNKDICLDCHKCSTNCISFSSDPQPGLLGKGDCTKCLSCLQDCPKQGALNLQLGGSK